MEVFACVSVCVSMRVCVFLCKRVSVCVCLCLSVQGLYQVLDATVIHKVPAALGEAGEQHLDQALVPAGAHGQEAVLQIDRQQKQPITSHPKEHR